MGISAKVARILGPSSRPGLTNPGSDPYRLIAWYLRAVPSPVVVDVGCNEGHSIQKVLDLHPAARIHGFEPSPDTAERCRARFASDPRITIHPFAVGDAPGTLTLHRHERGVTDSLLPDDDGFKKLTPAGWTGARSSVDVRVDTLDAVAPQLGLTRIDLLKTDTQGFDDRVLTGARGLLSRGAISIVYAELIFAPLYKGQGHPHQIMTILADNGYRLVGLFQLKHEDGPAISWCDGLFVHQSMLPAK